MLPTNIFNYHPLTRRKSGAILPFYTAVVGCGILHHELWFDEAQSYLSSCSSNSWAQLLYNTRFEVHPVLWNALLFIITRFSANPFYMQMLNALLSCIAAWIFLKHSPFNLLFKLLFVFGYFMIYEYSVISRDYALSCVCLFTVLGLYPHRTIRPAMFGLSVAALANTHLYCTAISIALLIVLLIEYFWSAPLLIKQSRREIFVACVIALTGVIFAVYHSAPPADYFKSLNNSHPLFWMEEIRKVYATPFRGMFNLPDFTTYCSWNTNYFTDRFWSAARLFLLLPAVLALILLYKKPKALLFFLLSAIGIMILEYISVSTATRHGGLIYFSFIAALWMSRYEPETNWLEMVAWLNTGLKATEKPAYLVVWIVLIVQVISAAALYAKDFLQPFSESREVSEYLKARNLQNEMIMVSGQCLGPQISAYLNRPVFYMEANREGTFCYWDVLLLKIPDSAIIALVNQQLAQHDSIIVLLDHPLVFAVTNNLQQEGVLQHGIELVQSFDHAFVKSENYWIYLARAKDKNKSSG